MINFNKILKTIFAFLQYLWQKIIHLFFGKKKSNINEVITIWKLNNNNISNNNFFSNKNTIRSKKIRPFKRKIRGLDIENGGVEESDNKTQKHVKDAWDDRAKNLLKAGQISPISSTNKKAMLVWYAKLRKTQENIKLGKKTIKKKLDIPKNFGVVKNTTFTQQITANKQHNNNNSITR